MCDCGAIRTDVYGVDRVGWRKERAETLECGLLPSGAGGAIPARLCCHLPDFQHVTWRKVDDELWTNLITNQHPERVTSHDHTAQPLPFTMAMQPCRSALARSRQSLRLAGLRACYATGSATTSTPTPESFKISESQSSERPPRWSQTPAGMKAPIQMDVSKNPENKIWVVNSDPEILNEMYSRLLGPGGSKMLPEELKWLAVTHKSFDQGRRGFNDRLALMGTIDPPVVSAVSCFAN